MQYFFLFLVFGALFFIIYKLFSGVEESYVEVEINESGRNKAGKIEIGTHRIKYPKSNNFRPVIHVDKEEKVVYDCGGKEGTKSKYYVQMIHGAGDTSTRKVCELHKDEPKYDYYCREYDKICEPKKVEPDSFYSTFSCHYCGTFYYNGYRGRHYLEKSEFERLQLKSQS